jgi:hypothetical protein
MSLLITTSTEKKEFLILICLLCVSCPSLHWHTLSCTLTNKVSIVQEKGLSANDVEKGKYDEDAHGQRSRPVTNGWIGYL